MTDEAKARDLLERVGQGHVLRFYAQLNAAQRATLLAQIDALDVENLERMRAMVATADAPAGGDVSADAIDPAPVLTPDAAQRALAAAEGEAALRAGRVGVILVAGGQGSRLGYEGPKGCFPIGPVSDASLFEIHARKVLARERRFGAPLPLYIMTSEANDSETREFFARHGNFGLAPENVLFFVQGMWPALDLQGHMLLDRPDHLFMSPDGHGGTLSALARNGMLSDMAMRGIETLFYFQVDNPMVDLADPVFIGLHRREGAEMSLKVCAKRDPDEGLGVVVLRQGRPSMVEYSELTASQRRACAGDGGLRLRYGSVAIHLFQRAFLEQAAARPMPLHLAFKKVPYCDEGGRLVVPDQSNAWKFEQFIFDVLPDARKSLHLVFDRRDEFSPVKNRDGADSPESSQRDLGAKFARWLEAAGLSVPRDADGFPRVAIEIDPLFADSPETLKNRIDPTLHLTGDLLLREQG